MPNAILYQFPVSHYCEKARWALDAAKEPYVVKNLAMGEHMFVVPRLKNGARTVPVLVRGKDDVIADSRGILDYAITKSPSLLPEDPKERETARELIRFHDEELGPAVRIFAYRYVLESLPAFRTLAFRELDPLRRAICFALATMIRNGIRRRYKIEARADAAKKTIEDAADRVDAALKDKPYLASSRFTAADLTAASLWGPLFGVPGSPWLPVEEVLAGSPVVEMKKGLVARPLGHWIRRVYAEHRRPV